MEENKENYSIGMYSFSMNNTELPVFKEVGNKDWIPYGDDNLYPSFLIDLMNHSTKHNSLIKKKTNMTAGNGFIETENNKVLLDNSLGKEDLNTIAYKCAYDQMIYAGYCFAITWNKARTAIVRISYVDYSKVRRCAENIDDDTIQERMENGTEFFWISPDWKNYRKSVNTPKLIQGLSEEYNEEATQLVYIQDYKPGTDFYYLPDYYSAIKWIDSDKQIAEFHNSSIKNGFTPSMMISFRSRPSAEEMEETVKKMKKNYEGASNGSKVMFTFTEMGEEAPVVTPIDLNSSDEKFMNLETQIQDNIIQAHLASPIVAGIATSGKLGSTAEIEEAEMTFQKNVIDQKQSSLEYGFNKVTKINGTEALQLEKFISFDDIKEEENEVEEKIEE